MLEQFVKKFLCFYLCEPICFIVKLNEHNSVVPLSFRHLFVPSTNRKSLMRSVELFRGSCVHCCAAFLFPLGCANYCYYINL